MRPILVFGKSTRLITVIATLSFALLINARVCQAQTTSITRSGQGHGDLGTKVSDQTIRDGRINYDITGGTRPGNGPNLFHSFGEFSVGKNNIVTFLNQDGLDTSNIVSRVTGGNVSKIFGAIDSWTNFRHANFWLINPAGVIFGPTAELFVGGSVNISTADYLRLAHGNKFTALPGPADKTLSMAPVEAFGFIGGTPTPPPTQSQTGRITLQGEGRLGVNVLHVALSKDLVLVGRDNFVGGSRHPGIEMHGGYLDNPGVRLSLVSVDQPVDLISGGEVSISSTSRLTPQHFNSLGEIRLIGNAVINAKGNQNNIGEIFLQGGNIAIGNGVSLITVASSAASGGDIIIQANGDLTLSGSSVLTEAKVSPVGSAGRDAGSINLSSGNNLLVKNSRVSTESAEGSGGNITLTAPHVIRVVDSTLTSSVKGQVGSNGGNILIDPIAVAIQHSQILANANAGAGGAITIAASGAVLIDPNSLLDASAGPAGISGSVNINAPLQVLSGTLVPLKVTYSQPGLSSDRCTADPQGQFSSFVQTGRDGVPQIPGALAPSPLLFLDHQTSNARGSAAQNLTAARLGMRIVGVEPSPHLHFYSTCGSW